MGVWMTLLLLRFFCVRALLDFIQTGVSEGYMEYVQKTAIQMKWFSQERSFPCIQGCVA